MRTRLMTVCWRSSEHWDDNPQDYLMFVTTALAVFSYPFMPASVTASQSPAVAVQKTSSKPISDEMFTYLALVKAGYGTLAELKELDTPELLDIIEFK